MIQKKSKRIAILGGSYDPPTIAHALMATEILNQGLVDEIVFVPCGARTDKKLQEGSERVAMLQKMIQDFFPDNVPIKVDTIELVGEMIPTYFMLTQLKDKYDGKLYFVIGSDLVKDLRKWHEGDKLVEEFDFIILNRSGYDYDQGDLPKKYTLVQNFDPGISSTLVRKRIKENASNPWRGVMGLVTPKVLSHIVEQNLYV